ncbi:hypothetical protein PLESTF_001528100 [Pleodorina starrii]|nr:hypothetical protein PLESTF_001528100 [Pleodorina starrii]
MISSVATAAAAEKIAQEQKRRRQQLLGAVTNEEQQQTSPSSSSDESVLDAPGGVDAAPGMVRTLEAHTQQPATGAALGAPDVLNRNDADQHQQQVDRSPATPAAAHAKKQLQQLLEPEPAPATADRQNPAPRGPPSAAPTNLVARLVDAILTLTNERFGASLRVQRRQADEVVQGVAEAVEESERGDTSVSLSLAGTTQPSTGTPQDTGLRAPVGPRFADEVENVFKYDLMEDNPNWKSFLTSSTGLKAQAWEARRQAASSPLRRALYSKPREWIYMTLSYPDHSRLAHWIGVFIIVIILLNTITFCIESVPRYANTPVYESLTVVDYVCMGIFTAEYVARLATCPDLPRFLRSLSNLIDLVAILPFYVELCVKGTSTEAFQTRVVRLLRVFRVLRIVKTMPKLRHLTLVSDTLRDSLEVLIMLALLLLVLLVVFGTIIFFIEPDTFDSIPQAMYYAQTTLTTTGYGDIFPLTPWGRFVAGAAMLLCMVVVSLPIAVIGGNFSEKWSDYKSFMAAVDRSSRVYPAARSLLAELERYEAVLDDVMKRLQECEVASEKQLRGVREQLAAARAALLHGTAAASGGGGGLAGPPPSSGGGGAAAAAVGELPSANSGGRLFAVAMDAMRRMRNGSGATMRRTGSVSAAAAAAAAAAVESPRGSGADLAGLADVSAHGTSGGGGPYDLLETSGRASPRHQPDLRSAAALTTRGAPQRPLAAGLEEEGEGEQEAQRAGAGLGSKGRGSGFRAVVARVMKSHALAAGLANGAATASEASGSSGGGGGSAGGAPHTTQAAAGNPFAVAATTAAAAVAAATAAASGGPDEPAPSPPPPPPPQSNDTCHPHKPHDPSEDDLSLQLPLPPPPPPPPAAPPPPAPPPHPPAPAFSQPSLAAGPNNAGLAASSLSLSGLALQFTNSITSLLGRWNGGGAAAAAASTAAAAALDESAAAPALPMDPAALDIATSKLDHAAAGCNVARDLRVRYEALAAQAEILRTDDMPTKLEKLDEQYRQVRCWQDELGPMAERMWCLRDALDQLAWALQEGVPEEQRSYKPACEAARAAEDEALGVVRRRKTAAAGSGGGLPAAHHAAAGVAAAAAGSGGGGGDAVGSVRAGVGVGVGVHVSAGEAARTDGAAAAVLSLK